MKILSEKELPEGDYLMECDFDDEEYKIIANLVLKKYLKNEADQLHGAMNKIMSFGVTQILKEEMERIENEQDRTSKTD